MTAKIAIILLSIVYLVITGGIEQRIFHRLGDPMYTTGSRTVVFSFCLSRVFAIPLYYTCALIKLLIGILFSIFATFPYTMT